jgi:1-acyl-sn-glycerol-3-phosphate acyltransferase
MALRVPALPPQAPRDGNAFSRWLGRSVLRLGGWTIVGQFPDRPRLVLLAAPHSSGWDAVWGLAAKLAMGVDITFMAKAELFRGPLGWLLRALGGQPVDRARAHGAVEQAAASILGAERMWFVLAPEGTRRRVEHWKSGFWHIARAADVPVFCAWFHYPDRTIGLGELFEMTGDLRADMARIRAYYRPFVGKHRGTD